MIVNLHRGAQPFTFVHIQGHQALFSLLRLAFLFLEGHEKILLQSPVQKDADGRHLHHPQKGQLIPHNPGLGCRCNHPVLGILIQKHIHLISRLRSLRHLPARQEHGLIRLFLLPHISANLCQTHNLQQLSFSQFHHFNISFLSCERAAAPMD